MVGQNHHGRGIPDKPKLLDTDIITEADKTFSATKKLFVMWINKIYDHSPTTQKEKTSLLL